MDSVILPTGGSAYWYQYRTKTTNNIYPLEIGLVVCRVGDLTYDLETVRGLCKTGCRNYGLAGGCPPRAPRLDEIAEERDPVWLIYCRFWSVFKPPRVAASRNPAVHWKFQDGVVSRFLVKIGHSLAGETRGGFLSTGYCMGCAGKKCNYKTGKNFCSNPAKRTFSIEATGVNVVESVKRLFGLEMYWYSRGSTDIPYMVKCIAILPKTGLYAGREKDLLFSTLGSFVTDQDSFRAWHFQRSHTVVPLEEKGSQAVM